MIQKTLVKFAGTDGPVDLTGCAGVLTHIPAIFQRWPFAQFDGDECTADPVLLINNRGRNYRISSPLNDKIQDLADPLNVACSLVAELAWARLRHQPEYLCFHGAAVEFNGALVLFPNRRRAGKSTLTACLAALGYRVFTDDYLPLDLDETCGFIGIANGAAPRLRLPVPDEFSTGVKTYFNACAGPQNKQYLYLHLADDLLAPHGTRAPISTVVLLDRVEDAAPELINTQPTDVLRRLIKQNFSRSMNPARILEMLGVLVSNTSLKTLRYSNAEQAAALLGQTLRYAPVTPPSLKELKRQPGILSDSLVNIQDTINECRSDCAYVQSDFVVALDYDNACFLASSHGARIHYLNQMAKAVWTMLKTPVTPAKIVAVFQNAFPDQQPETVKADVTKTVSGFLRHGLLKTHDDLSNIRDAN